MIKRAFLSLAFSILFFCLALSPAGASRRAGERHSANHGPAPSRPVSTLKDRAQLEAFFDGLVAGQLEAYHIAGAAVAVVQDGRVLLAKGYGLADARQRTPVSAEATLFRMASISKLFTWTAVMQLVEQGRLDLKRDVNSYLDTFRIPGTFAQPITLEHLMTHTAGFEDLVMGIGARRAENVLSLEKYLRERLPKRIRPPGMVTAYSNYGPALAGYIVQKVSGRPFEEYVEENILKPLGMDHSTFRQPPPGPLAAGISSGHIVRDGLLLAQSFEFVNGLTPAGALSSTASDMARFMIAHLELGAYGQARILRPETVRIMQERLFTNDRRLSGNAHGFWERQANGLRLIGHGGDTWLFHSQLILIPEERTGLLVVYNTQTAASPARDELVQAFLDKFYPVPAAIPPQPRPSERPSLRRYAGWYGLSRNSSSTLEKIMGLALAIRVSVTAQGTLLTRFPAGLGARQWVEVNPDVFRRADGRDTLIFGTDSRGRVTFAFLDSLPLMAGVKLRGFQTPPFHGAIAFFCLALFFFAFSWPLGWLRRKICGVPIRGKRAPWWGRWTVFLFSALDLGFAVSLVRAASRPEQFLLGLPSSLRIGLWLVLVSIPLVALSAFFAISAWRHKYWTACARVFYSLVTMAGLLYFVLLAYWHLIGMPG
jgi:CubicO group peptidase (beta-lactamase class C family)